MKTILITGFTPFGKDRINPSYEAIKLLPDTMKDASIIKLEIETSFAKAPRMLEQAIDLYHPDYVICVGQAGGRKAITPEFVAINYAHASIADNDGNQPLQQPIVKDGPSAYFTSLPVYAMVDAMNKHEIPASVSYSAGTYVCNYLMYSALYFAHTKYMFKAGFIHVPYIHEQIHDTRQDVFSMDLLKITKGLELCIEAILDNETDIPLENYGKIC